MGRFSLSKIKDEIGESMRRGTTPQKLALTCALGVIVSIFPLFGTTTLLCFLLAFCFRLNVILIQLVNYLAAPLQLILIFPFIKSGSHVFGVTFAYSKEELLHRIQTDFWSFLNEASASLAAGVGAWLIAAVPLFALFYYSCFALIGKWKAKDIPVNS